jgi:hypothetical protein
LLRKIIFDIQFNPYWPKWQTKCSKLADKNFETSDFHQDTCNRYIMLGFLSAHIPWNAISKLELWQSYKALRDDQLYCPLRPLVTFAGGILPWLWMQLRSNCQYKIKLV